MNSVNRSKTLEEVRRLKAECNREVAHLPLREALEKRLRDSARAAEEMGFFAGSSQSAGPRIAAEPAAEYRVKRAAKRQIRPPEAVSHSKTVPGDRK